MWLYHFRFPFKKLRVSKCLVPKWILVNLAFIKTITYFQVCNSEWFGSLKIATYGRGRKPIIANFSLQEIERRLLQLELLKKARMPCELQDDADVRFDWGKTVRFDLGNMVNVQYYKYVRIYIIHTYIVSYVVVYAYCATLTSFEACLWHMYVNLC